MSPEPAPDARWHTLAPAQALASLSASEAGLSDEESAQRLQRFGPNEIASAKPVSWFRILLNQLATVVVLLLVAAAVVSAVLGETAEAAAVAAVLIINTAVGFAIDLRARQAMAALRNLEVPRALVIRGGQPKIVDSRSIVPGDVLDLHAGQAVPADGRILSTNDLRVIEAPLTGESLPVSKDPAAVLEPDTPLADRITMVYKGTTIAAGAGRAIVTATGSATELGRIGILVASIEDERTPLERRLDALGHRLVWLALGVGAVVALLAAAQGESLAIVLETGIALAVAAVPEALPAVVTIALAVGLHRMALRHALVRRLPAVESLGSTTVVCADKTQTLTSGDMTLTEIWPPGARATRALEAGALASLPESEQRGEDGAGAGVDPVDTAFLKKAEEAGIDPQELARARPRLGFIPFSTERKLTAVFHSEGGGMTAYLKGAPGRIVELCDRVVTEDGDEPLSVEGREHLLDVNRDLARRGLRVLGLAIGRVEKADESALRGLTCVGFAGLIDPPAPGVRETIARLKEAGLRTIMITGDQRLTAEAVARELGLLESGGEIIEGRELAGMSAEELTRRLPRVAAFSRVSPEDKLNIVKALQEHGEIVAMLGDGVNDAAALRQSDVGVAMGKRGTDVAKEASDIVLQDDRFETIAAAVEEGRIIYDNIGKFVFYLFSCNLAEVLVVLVVGLSGLPLPLLPLQILWLNIVTDTFPALALAFEPGEPGIMHRPPRSPQQSLLSRAFLRRMALDSALITAVTLVGFVTALERGREHATTMGFMTLALTQIFHLRNARRAGSESPAAPLSANPYAIASLVLTVGLQVAAVNVPSLARVLRLAPMDLADWVTVLALSSIPVAAHMAWEAWRGRIFPPLVRNSP